MSVIAIDIDGLLTVNTEGHDYANRLPHRLNLHKLRELIQEGHSCFYYTSRMEVDRSVTHRWLTENGFPNLPLFMGKPQADIYVDDKSVKGFDEI